MPNGDTIRVQLPDGRTGTIPKQSLAKAQKAGWKVIDDSTTGKIKEGATTFGREAVLGAASGLGIAESPKPLTDTVKQFGAQPSTGDIIGSSLLGPAYGVGKGLASSAAEMFEGMGADAKQPSKFGPFDPAKTGHGAGSLLSQILMLRGGSKTAEKPLEAGGTKAVARDLLGVGERDVAGEMKKTAAKEAKVQETAAKKVDTAKQKYAEAVQDAMKKRAEASARETAAKTKQEALQSKHGPVYKRMNEMADTAREHVGKIEETVKAQEGQKWADFSKKMENAPVNSEPTVQAIQNAQEKILSGDSVPIFKQVLAELPGTDPDVEAMLQNATPSMRERLLASGIKESPEVGLDTARKLYTKISRKLGGSELPRDVARALSTVADALDSSISEGIAKKGGATALKQYRKLQADWKQYRQTFSDRDSPLRKIMEAKDPSTKLGPITGETGARAVEYLGRYRDMGAQPEQLGKIRALHKALKELPGGGGKAPEMPDRPSLPEKPATKEITPQSARKDMLVRKESFYSRPPSRWELMFPPLLAYKMTLKHLMQNPKFIEWLSKDTGGGGGNATPVP
jgi:hypothetical protein